jgi:hypothetical protein
LAVRGRTKRPINDNLPENDPSVVVRQNPPFFGRLAAGWLQRNSRIQRLPLQAAMQCARLSPSHGMARVTERGQSGGLPLDPQTVDLMVGLKYL